MPTPIGHSLAGAIIYALSTKGKDLLKSWKWLAVCVLFAALADIDFVPALFGRLDIANHIHRHMTHTLLFAVIVSGGAFGVLKALRNPRSLRYSAVIFLCLASHVFLDMVGKDFRPPIGVPFLWPFVRRSFKIPVDIFLNLHKDTYGEIFSLYNVGVLAREVIIFGSILLILAIVKLGYASPKRESHAEGVVAKARRRKGEKSGDSFRYGTPTQRK
ncbi:metal-dependent hydrolase [bacterium]|nr:metal-dependent hydrolase [bacterium]